MLYLTQKKLNKNKTKTNVRYLICVQNVLTVIKYAQKQKIGMANNVKVYWEHERT